MKCSLGDTVPVLAKKSKHKLGYNSEEFPWHSPEDDSAVIRGLLCSLIQYHITPTL